MYAPNPFVDLLSTLIHLYIDVLVVWLIVSWLTSFGIINTHQPLVRRISYALFRLTEPLLRPIRKVLPDLGGIDISPIILILALNFINSALFYYF